MDGGGSALPTTNLALHDKNKGHTLLYINTTVQYAASVYHIYVYGGVFFFFNYLME